MLGIDLLQCMQTIMGLLLFWVLGESKLRCGRSEEEAQAQPCSRPCMLCACTCVEWCFTNSVIDCQLLLSGSCTRGRHTFWNTFPARKLVLTSPLVLAWWLPPRALANCHRTTLHRGHTNECARLCVGAGTSARCKRIRMRLHQL